LVRAFDTGHAASLDIAVALLTKAISMAPADAYLWTALSWTQLALENPDKALDALERSWSLAPHNVALAGERLLIAQALGLPAAGTADHRLAADWTIAERFGRVDPSALILNPEP
jgi:predicted Zn-dependent protease